MPVSSPSFFCSSRRLPLANVERSEQYYSRLGLRDLRPNQGKEGIRVGNSQYHRKRLIRLDTRKFSPSAFCALHQGFTFANVDFHSTYGWTKMHPVTRSPSPPAPPSPSAARAVLGSCASGSSAPTRKSVRTRTSRSTLSPTRLMSFASVECPNVAGEEQHCKGVRLTCTYHSSHRQGRGTIVGSWAGMK
jgi:hypothetical protein